MASQPPQDVNVVWRNWPHARIWFRYETSNGDVAEFAVQLDYNHRELEDRFKAAIPPDWKPVARLDHSYNDHDWRHEPPHVDIYENGQKVGRLEDFGMVDPNEGIDFAIEFLEQQKKTLLLTYEEKHDLEGPYSGPVTPTSQSAQK